MMFRFYVQNAGPPRHARGQRHTAIQWMVFELVIAF